MNSLDHYRADTIARVKRALACYDEAVAASSYLHVPAPMSRIKYVACWLHITEGMAEKWIARVEQGEKS